MIKLATLLMTHTTAAFHPASVLLPPVPVMSFIMTNNQPSQYTKLMISPNLGGQQVQFNEPDGSTGYRDGTNYYIYQSKLSNFPQAFFTTKPSP